MNRQLVILLAGLLLISATSVSAANLKGAYSVTPLIGGYSYDGKQHLDTNLVYGVRAGYNLTKSIGVEALFDYVHNTDSTIGSFKGLSMQRYGGEALYHFFPDSAFVPYVAAGYAGLNFDGDNKKKTVGAFDYGVGAKYFFNDRFALRGDVRHLMYSYDRTYHNLEYTLGAHIPFGGVSPIAKTVEPVQEQMSAQPATSCSDQNMPLLKLLYLPAPEYPSNRPQLPKGRRPLSPGTRAMPLTARSNPVSVRSSSMDPCASRRNMTLPTRLPVEVPEVQRSVRRPILLSTFHHCRFRFRLRNRSGRPLP